MYVFGNFKVMKVFFWCFMFSKQIYQQKLQRKQMYENDVMSQSKFALLTYGAKFRGFILNQSIPY